MDRPREEIEQERQELLAAVGEATNQWVWVEVALFKVFNRLVRPDNYNAASAAFHSIINFNSKLAMVDAAAKFAIDSVTLSIDWERLNKKIGRAAQKRNIIAHQAVYTNHSNPKGYAVYLGPPLSDIRKIPAIYEAANYPLKRVHDIEKSFRLLSEKIKNFEERLPKPLKTSGDAFMRDPNSRTATTRGLLTKP